MKIDILFPWPSDKDKVFEEITAWEPPPHWMDIFSRDTYLPNVYKESADIIIDHIEEGKVRGNTGIFLSPIAYLYRHSFELCLKKLIHQGIALGILKHNGKLKKILGDHKLYPLWNKVRIVLEICGQMVIKMIWQMSKESFSNFIQSMKVGSFFVMPLIKRVIPLISILSR